MEAAERFNALHTAYSVLSDPVRRQRYDIEQRLQHRREWRRAWEGQRMQPLLTDKSGGEGEQLENGVEAAGAAAGVPADDCTRSRVNPFPALHHDSGMPVPSSRPDSARPAYEESFEPSGASVDYRAIGHLAGESAGVEAERAERARQWDAQRVAWLQQQAEEAEARRMWAEEERAAREADRARRKAREARRRREREETQRAAEEARALREDEEQARAVEERVRAQVEARARRHGEQTARREAAEAVRQAEERARAATQAAEEKETSAHLKQQTDKARAGTGQLAAVEEGSDDDLDVI